MTDQCLIWSAPCAKVSANYKEYESDGIMTEDAFDKVVGSRRAGGDYIITVPAKLMLDPMQDSVKARLTSWLVEQRMRGVDCPAITTDEVEYAKGRKLLAVHERAERLLRCLVEQSRRVGETLFIRADIAEATGADRHPDSLFERAMAWSESLDRSEVVYLASYLENRAWIESIHLARDSECPYGYKVTVAGYSHVADLYVNPDSSQCFVAMWFDDSMTEAYEKGIRSGIESAGYVPMRIDRKEDLIDKIDDAIIAEIRRSRFLVADFTHGEEGSRGGVYYEAGFAYGLSIPVIYTCRKDKIGELHFDTRQINHIVWQTPSELHEQLTSRILAVIGEGPK